MTVSHHGEMVERFKAHAWKACEVNSLRRFKSCSLRQEQSRLNFVDEMYYIFINGVAGVIGTRLPEQKSYANNYNVHGANGKFARV